MQPWFIPMFYVSGAVLGGLALLRIEQAYLSSYTLGVSVASAQALLSAAASGNKLVNVNNTIFGAGTIGQSGLAFDNQAGGIIDATGATHSLVLTGSSSFTNEGLIEATGQTRRKRYALSPCSQAAAAPAAVGASPCAISPPATPASVTCIAPSRFSPLEPLSTSS